MTIVPRWEWRSFGDRFGPAELALTALVPTEVVESAETYLLSVGDTDVVKVRDDLMDVKRRKQVDENGLEQWRPVMKAPFPITAADVGSALSALGVESPRLSRSEYALAELVDEVVGEDPDLLAVEVHKRRHRYRVGECLAELTDVRVGERSTRTIAVESEDPSRVIGTVRELGLAVRPNVNYARGLKTLTGFGVERFAVIDIGTNSVKLHVSERGADGVGRTLADRAEITRLGEGLERSGRLEPEPVQRTIAAVAGMAGEAVQQRVAAIAAVGTAGLRMASNSADVVDQVLAHCGVVVEVISGEEEARLAFLAATSGLPASGSRVVFDTGGGSSQFTFGDAGQVDDRFSVDVGAVRLTEEFGLERVVSDETLAAALRAIDDGLGRLAGRRSPDALVGMGGAVTNLAAVRHGLVEYDPDVVQGTVLDRAEIDRQIELYRGRDADERRTIAGLQPQRAEVILAGACIVRTVLEKLGRDSFTVSDRALRHGVLAERFGTVAAR